MDFRIFEVPGSSDRNLRKVLGSGSFGVVFQTSNRTALKVIFLDYEYDLERQNREERRVRKEFEALEGKSHRNIIKMISATTTYFTPTGLDRLFGDYDQLFRQYPKMEEQVEARRRKAVRYGQIKAVCLEMELCGPTLRDWLDHVQDYVDELSADLRLKRGHRMDKFEVYEITKVQAGVAQGLLEGLKFLHDNGRGILHRDLKPDNIMFTWTKDGTFCLPIKLGDFGLCRPIQQNAENHHDLNNNNLRVPNENLAASRSSPLGKDYQAPGTTAANYSTHSELHSLGLVLYELLQPAPWRQLKERFDRLVLDRDNSELQEHFILDNAVYWITFLTRRDVQLRTFNIWQISLDSRARVVRDSAELVAALKFAVPGQLIHLEGGEYRGCFEIVTNGVVLEGGINGRPTIFKAEMTRKRPALLISGSYCLVTNISVEIINSATVVPDKYTGIQITNKGRGNNLHKVRVEYAKMSNSFTYKQSIEILGNANILEKCKFVESETGIVVGGRDNKLRNTKLNCILGLGIDMIGNLNQIVNVNFTKVRNGVQFRNGAKENTLKNLKYTKDTNNTNMGVTVVWVMEGQSNEIIGLECSGLNFERGDLGLNIEKKSECTTVLDSFCGSVLLDGKGDIFKRVDLGYVKSPKGSSIVGFEDCVSGSAPKHVQEMLNRQIKTLPTLPFPLRDGNYVSLVTLSELEKWQAINFSKLNLNIQLGK